MTWPFCPLALSHISEQLNTIQHQREIQRETKTKYVQFIKIVRVVVGPPLDFSNPCFISIILYLAMDTPTDTIVDEGLLEWMYSTTSVRSDTSPRENILGV